MKEELRFFFFPFPFLFLTTKQLLELPNVNELRHSEDGHEKQLWSLVHLFAYDTFTTYSRNKSLYGELTPAMERKLKQLSIVSLAARHHVISYTDLKEELDIYDIRELEDLLLDTFYLGWISGKLDAKGEVLHVDFAISRDVRENDLVKVQAVLEKWCNKAEVLMETIDKKVSELRGAIQKETMDRREFENKVKSVQEQVAAMQLQKGGGGGGRDGGEFFMDDERGGGGGGQRRAAKTSRRRPN